MTFGFGNQHSIQLSYGRILSRRRIIANEYMLVLAITFSLAGVIEYNPWHFPCMDWFCMSAHEYDFPKTTKTQFILAALGALFAPLLVLFLVARLFFGIQSGLVDDPVVEQKPETAAAAKPADTASEDEDEDDADDEPAAEAPTADEEKSE